MGDDARSRNVGRFNFRAGHFYVPFGLNLQTDTHGTVLQLSNERNFGFERDWHAGVWGSINRHLNYDAYYLTGSGYDLKFKGQSGLGAVRVSLGEPLQLAVRAGGRRVGARGRAARRADARRSRCRLRR